MADHVFKHKKTGNETLLPESFGKTKAAEHFDDLGEGVILKHEGSGVNYVKLVSELKAEKKKVAKEAADHEEALKKAEADRVAKEKADKDAAKEKKKSVFMRVEEPTNPPVGDEHASNTNIEGNSSTEVK